jgi:hypothetical protein
VAQEGGGVWGAGNSALSTKMLGTRALFLNDEGLQQVEREITSVLWQTQGSFSSAFSLAALRPFIYRGVRRYTV